LQYADTAAHTRRAVSERTRLAYMKGDRGDVEQYAARLRHESAPDIVVEIVRAQNAIASGTCVLCSFLLSLMSALSQAIIEKLSTLRKWHPEKLAVRRQSNLISSTPCCWPTLIQVCPRQSSPSTPDTPAIRSTTFTRLTKGQRAVKTAEPVLGASRTTRWCLSSWPNSGRQKASKRPCPLTRPPLKFTLDSGPVRMKAMTTSIL
jgi:hypothetical protein